MLLPAKIDQLSVISGRIMDPIIQFLLRDIARRIAEAGKSHRQRAIRFGKHNNSG